MSETSSSDDEGLPNDPLWGSSEDEANIEWDSPVYVNGTEPPVASSSFSSSSSSTTMEDDDEEGESSEEEDWGDALISFMEEAKNEERRREICARDMIYFQQMKEVEKLMVERVALPSFVCHKTGVTMVPEWLSVVQNTRRRLRFTGKGVCQEFPQRIQYVPTSYEGVERVAGEMVGYASVHIGDRSLHITHINEFAYLVMACLMRDRMNSHPDKRLPPPQRVVGCNGAMDQVVRLLCNQYIMQELALLDPERSSERFDRKVDEIIDRHYPKVSKRHSRNQCMDRPEYVLDQLHAGYKWVEEMEMSERALLASLYYLGYTGNVKDHLELNLQQRGFTTVAFKTPKNALCDSNTVPSICMSSKNMPFSCLTTADIAVDEKLPADGERVPLVHCLPDVWTENAPPLSVIYQPNGGSILWNDLNSARMSAAYSDFRSDHKQETTMRFYRLFYQVFSKGTHPRYFRTYYGEGSVQRGEYGGSVSSVHTVCELQLLWVAYVLHIVKKHQWFSPVTREVLDRVLWVMSEHEPSYSSNERKYSDRMAAFHSLVGKQYLSTLSTEQVQKYLLNRCDVRYESEEDQKHLWMLVAAKASDAKKSRYHKDNRLDHYVALIYYAVKAPLFDMKRFYLAVNGLTTRVFSKRVSKEIREYYWSNNHILPVCVMPTLNRAMYFAIRAYFRLRHKPLPSLRQFYTPITANVTYDEGCLTSSGLKQSTLRRHKKIAFRGVKAIDHSVTEYKASIALPCTHVHQILSKEFLQSSVRAADLVHLRPSRDNQETYLVASRDLPAGTDLGILAGLEWLYARPKKSEQEPSVYQLNGVPNEPYVWQCYVGDSDDRRYRVFLQISTKHYGNYLRHVRRSSQPNSCFVATHPGLGARPSRKPHFSRLPVNGQYRRYWRLRIKSPVAKGTTISVSY